jgi:hypothetical protein
LPTVWYVTPSWSATAVLGLPLAHSRTISGVRPAARAVLGRRAQPFQRGALFNPQAQRCYRSPCPHQPPSSHTKGAGGLQFIQRICDSGHSSGVRDEQLGFSAEVVSKAGGCSRGRDFKCLAVLGAIIGPIVRQCVIAELGDPARFGMSRRWPGTWTRSPAAPVGQAKTIGASHASAR